MDELIGILIMIPFGAQIATGLGTLTAVCTIAHPLAKVIVRVTPFEWDDDILCGLEANKGLKTISKFAGFFKRFSLIK